MKTRFLGMKWGGSRKMGPAKTRTLRLECLERRALLSVSALSGIYADSSAVSAASLAATATVQAQAYSFDVVEKAQPDQWYTGIGGAYYAYTPGQTPPAGAIGLKVNQDYVWGMTQTSDSVWFGTAANVLSQASAAIGGTGVTKGYANKLNVTEGAQSKYSGIPTKLKPYEGDWRPPQVHRYNFTTGVYQNVTPNNSLIKQTLGLRSAGTARGVVLLAGPTIYGVGINLFAFNASTGQFLGAKNLAAYSDVRSWVTVGGANGELYAAVAKTSLRGGGAVLRWTGSVASPFSFQVVGQVDLEAASMVYHQGRLYVSTWPANYGSLTAVMGYSSKAHAGIWMSPALSGNQLTTSAASSWKKAWTIDQYEPDSVIAASYGGGAMASFDGYLYWGTMQVPGTGTVVFQKAYGKSPTGGNTRTDRSAALFRCANFDTSTTPSVELLYGSSQLWKYTGGTWSMAANKTGTPKFGQAGFDNPYNRYIWSMAVQDGVLYVGTYDSTTTAGDVGDTYVSSGGNLDAVEAYINRAWGVPGMRMGADLWALPAGNGQPYAVSKEGAGNPLNHGIRTMQATPAGLFLGTASASNLLTAPYNPPSQPLHAGGWELIHLTVGVQSQVQSQTLTTTSSAVSGLAAAVTSSSSSPATKRAADQVVADLAALTVARVQAAARARRGR